MEKAKLIIIDKREIFREGLALLLSNSPGIEVVGTCTCASEAVEKTESSVANIILINMEPEQDNIVEATQCICESLPSLRILILSHSDKERDLMSAIKAGARGYVAKSISTDDLVKTISLVAGGGVILSAPMAEKMISEIGSESSERDEVAEGYGLLTEREKEVLHLVAKGATNREIGNTLFIAENTVKVHLRSIMEKWHVHSRLQAMALAHEKGFNPDT